MRNYLFRLRSQQVSFKVRLLKFRHRLHGTGSVWNRYEIGTDKPCVYTEPGGSGTDRICYLVPNRSTDEGDPMWNRTVPVWNRSRVKTEWIRSQTDLNISGPCKCILSVSVSYKRVLTFVQKLGAVKMFVLAISEAIVGLSLSVYYWKGLPERNMNM